MELFLPLLLVSEVEGEVVVPKPMEPELCSNHSPLFTSSRCLANAPTPAPRQLQNCSTTADHKTPSIATFPYHKTKSTRRQETQMS